MNKNISITTGGILDDAARNYFSEIDYTPHNAQLAFHSENARFRVLVCGRRWGKTVAAAREAELLAIEENKKIWIVAPTYDLTGRIFNEVKHNLLFHSKDKIKRINKTERSIELTTDSSIIAKTADNPVSLLGEGLDLLIIDEAARVNHEIWDVYLRPALTDRKGKAILISTPAGHNWFEEMFNLGQDENFTAWWSLKSPSWDNSRIFPQGADDPEFKESQKIMSAERFAQEFGAEFVAPQDRVYKGFSRNKNICNDEPSMDISVYLGIDFGFRHPAIVSAYQMDDRLIVFDEFGECDVSVLELIDWIKTRKYFRQIQAIYCDPAGKSVNSFGTSEIIMFRNAGLPVSYSTNRENRMLAGTIERVRNLIGEYGETSRLFINSKCTSLITSLEGYHYPPSVHSLSDIPRKDGVHDHFADALRYLIINLYPLGRCIDRHIIERTMLR